MVSVKSSIKFDDRRARKKLQAKEREILKSAEVATKELVNLGKRHARMLVPKYSRQTYDAIRGRTERTVDGAKGKVFVLLRQRTGDNKTTHDVAKLMADGKPSYNHYTSGRPKFMKETRDYLNRIKTKIGNKNIKKGKAPSLSTSV